MKLMFTETAMFTSRCTKSIARKVNRASHGPGVLAKGRVRRTPKVNPKVPKVPKVRTRVKRQTLVDPVLKTPKSEDKFRNMGICTDVSHRQLLYWRFLVR